jgi:hypothetical protein
MERQPITRQRSEWTQLPSDPDAAWERGLTAHGAEVVGIYERRVGDGGLRAIVTRNLGKWHMSISFHDHRGKLTRYPRWDEIADARYALCPDEITMAMLLPPSTNYVAVHDTTFHLHEVEIFPSLEIGGL